MAKQSREFYLNNPNLPTGAATYEYTPEMIRHLKKSKQNLLYFAENFYYIIDPDEGRRVISLFKYQKEVLRMIRDNRYNILLASRQSGKSTLMCIFSLWVACFTEDQSIVIVANKEQTAIEIFRRVRLAYEQLPNWLKPGVKEWGKTGLELDNGSKIGISTTTGTAARGTSLNCLIIDELAFIEPQSIVSDFWRSVWPTISRSKSSKILIASTPNGTDNLFHTLYDGAMKGENGFVCSTIRWDDMPGRDEDWKKSQIKAMGSVESFAQEYNCEFHSKGESTIDIEMFEKFKAHCKAPQYELEDGAYLLWDVPKEDNLYVASIDTSEGVGQDASVIQILDITNLTDIEQVAIYHNKNITPAQFTTKANEILSQWGKPLVMIERNGCGAQVADNLLNQYHYENIVNYGSGISGRKREQTGIVSHTNTKSIAVNNMRYWVNTLQAVKFNHLGTITELKDFVRKPNGTWSARNNSNDDCVTSLMWALMILENNEEKGVCQKYFEIEQVDEYGKPRIIKPMDFGLKYFERSKNSMSSFIKRIEADQYGDAVVCPMIFGSVSSKDSEEVDLMDQGWERLF